MAVRRTLAGKEGEWRCWTVVVVVVARVKVVDAERGKEEGWMWMNEGWAGIEGELPGWRGKGGLVGGVGWGGVG